MPLVFARKIPCATPLGAVEAVALNTPGEEPKSLADTRQL